MAQQQYRPGGGFGGSSGFGGGDGAGGFNDPSSGDTEGSLEETIPGVPGDDYPIFAQVPDTSFLCDGQSEGGYYADPEAECQVFHICGNDGNGGLTKYSFLCPNGTIFQQQYFVCDWWFNVDCSLTESLYSINDQNAAERESYSDGVFGARIETDGGRREEVSAAGRRGEERRNSGKQDAQSPGSAGQKSKSSTSSKSSSRGSNRKGGSSRRGNGSGQSSNSVSLSSYGGKSGLSGGYEAIGSPGFGGQGAFGPDGVFFGEGSEGLASYNRNARDILNSQLDDYINLQDY